jgi:hypothetical protein
VRELGPVAVAKFTLAAADGKEGRIAVADQIE